MKGKEIVEPQFANLFQQQVDEKIPALPLQFDHIPVELLSKQFTKLNNPHPYRIYYLGPRFLHTLALHRRYAYNEEFKPPEKDISYPAPLRRIFNSNYMNERLRDNHHYRSSFFYRAFEGMNPTLPSDQLVFNSSFQNGNLDCAIKIGALEYDLFLRIDSNSRGHTNWYYFSVKNKGTTQSIRFNICNLKKKLGLYDQGFQPFVKSTKAFDIRGEGWSQRGEGVQLQATPLRYELLKGRANNFYRLSFSYKFQYEDDEVFFAYCAPYTYSDLHQDISKWSKNKNVKKSILGRSLSGLQLPLLHITNHSKKGFNGLKKKNIVVTGRVHPGQSNGSYVLRGFIEWVIGSTKEASELRQRTNFFIIPMLNPDGVVMGNSRTSAAGKDLNRQFTTVRRDLYPQVYYTKLLITRLQKKHKVLLFLDFHGHSQRKNTFFYGPTYPISHRDYYRCRAFPKLIEKINPSFRFYGCSFQISETKRSAARAVALTQLRVPYAYTVESSVGLYYDPFAMKTYHFSIESWEEMGRSIACGLNQFILGIQELEQISRERKLIRQKIKEGKFKQKQKQSEEKKDRKRFILLDAIEEVKVAVSKGVFDDDIESDDHNSDEDLQQYQLNEFNNLVISGKQRQRKEERKIVEEEYQKQQVMDLSEIEDEDELQINPFQEPIKINKPQVFRNTRSVQPKSNWTRIIQSSQRRKKPKKEQDERKILVSTALRSSSSSKNFVKVNRQRFSSTNLNFFGQDRCEIISLPKTPLIKREQANPRPKQQHFNKLTSQIGKFHGVHSIVDKIEANIGKKHQNIIDTSQYQSLKGMELENRAIVVTTFRKR